MLSRSWILRSLLEVRTGAMLSSVQSISCAHGIFSGDRAGLWRHSPR
jgi:hypothetical protein